MEHWQAYVQLLFLFKRLTSFGNRSNLYFPNPNLSHYSGNMKGKKYRDGLNREA